MLQHLHCILEDMSNIIESVTEENQYLGMIRIDLRTRWQTIDSAYDRRTTCRTFASMRNWLNETRAAYKFEWENTGRYLPEYVWVEDDTAIVLKLKYNV